ncbi:MAG TPA: hypothetical protein VE398_25370 [Acidobacteriota bacterium]|nr:hypothetical protein [Acidobacteriota bacterium]
MKKLTIVSFFLTLVVSCLLLVVSTYSGRRDGFSKNGAVSVTYTRATLLQVNGQRVLIVLVAPVLIALMPLLIPKRGVRIAAAVLLSAFAFITGLSIGLFYFPSAGMLIVASVLNPRPRTV